MRAWEIWRSEAPYSGAAGAVEARLQIGDLVEHRVDLASEELQEVVDLLGVVALLGGGEGLLLDVLRCDSHVRPFRVSCAVLSGRRHQHAQI